MTNLQQKTTKRSEEKNDRGVSDSLLKSSPIISSSSIEIVVHGRRNLWLMNLSGEF